MDARTPSVSRAKAPALRLVFVPALALSALAALGCSGTGQPEVSYAAFAAPVVPGLIDAGGFRVSLDEAIVALGPVYFCAAASGSATLCETAVSEITEVSAIDALDPTLQPIGSVNGFTGAIRSASYDFGVHWFLTETSPVADPLAPGGHSARFRGRAERANESIDFVANVDVLAQFQGQRSVPTAPVSASVTEKGARLDVVVDVGAWIAAIDWEKAAESAERPLQIELGTLEHNALVIAMVSTRPPEFGWSPLSSP